MQNSEVGSGMEEIEIERYIVKKFKDCLVK
jgi:hypothetical protein